MAYVQAALDAGLKVDEFAPRLAFFFNGHNNVFQEVAKFRAARNMWAHAMKERFGAQDPKSLMLRFHTQTGGVTLTAQQPQNNIVRVALQAFAAVCGGTQSLHTNGYDEALALPTERAAKIALRTQQIVAHESGAADTVDPFAGSYYVESLTAEIERRAWKLIERVDELGGSVNAIAFIKNEIEESAFGYHERYRTEQDVVVGVNRYVEDDAEVDEILSVDPATERGQIERLKQFKAERDQELADRRLEELREAARGTDNLLPPLRAALKDRARSARYAAHCATSSASISPRFESVPPRRRDPPRPARLRPGGVRRALVLGHAERAAGRLAPRRDSARLARTAPATSTSATSRSASRPDWSATRTPRRAARGAFAADECAARPASGPPARDDDRAAVRASRSMRRRATSTTCARRAASRRGSASSCARRSAPRRCSSISRVALRSSDGGLDSIINGLPSTIGTAASASTSSGSSR